METLQEKAQRVSKNPKPSEAVILQNKYRLETKKVGGGGYNTGGRCKCKAHEHGGDMDKDKK